MPKISQPSVAPIGYDPVDAGFLEARGKLIEVAAFLDRVERRGREKDYRVLALRAALKKLSAHGKDGRAELVLRAFSDLTERPAPHAGPPAAGAFNPSIARKPRGRKSKK